MTPGAQGRARAAHDLSHSHVSPPMSDSRELPHPSTPTGKRVTTTLSQEQAHPAGQSGTTCWEQKLVLRSQPATDTTVIHGLISANKEEGKSEHSTPIQFREHGGLCAE